MKKLVLPISLTAIIALTGCGGGGSNGNSTSNKQVKVKASDAYVVKLETNATAEYNGHVYTSNTVDAGGEIVFNVPKDFNESMAIYKIPSDAWVDVNMNGEWDKNDTRIRMALEAKGNCVANPIGTAILEQEKPDMKLYEKFKNFDPVEAKQEIIKDDTNSTLMAEIIASDAIASALQEATKEHKNTHETCKAIKIDTLNNMDSYSNDTTALVNNLLANTNINKDTIIDRAQNELKAIHNAHKAHNENKKQALKDLIKFTDGQVK